MLYDLFNKPNKLAYCIEHQKGQIEILAVPPKYVHHVDDISFVSGRAQEEGQVKMVATIKPEFYPLIQQIIFKHVIEQRSPLEELLWTKEIAALPDTNFPRMKRYIQEAQRQWL